MAGVPRFKVSLNGDREGVAGLIQFLPTLSVVAKADHRKLQTHRAAPALVAKPPGGFPHRIAQHRQTHHRPVVAVEQPVIVDIHPFGEIRFRLTLHFDMHQHPIFCAIGAVNPHQLVGQPPA